MGFLGAWVFESTNLDIPGQRDMGGAGDKPVAGTGIDISQRASGTVIVGGSLTVKDFKDLGTDTLIVDRFAGSRPDRGRAKP